MDKPKRIQRKRTKGWKMPPNTIYVGRPSKWGNPFDHFKWGRVRAVEFFRLLTEDKLMMPLVPRAALSDANRHRNKFGVYFDRPTAGTFLRGKNLACWCPLDQPCHADVLLEIAND